MQSPQPALQISPVEQCCQALAALYQPTSTQPELQKQANDWLVAFQKKPIAWSVCDQILLNKQKPRTAHFFAATTLRTKIQYYYDDLSQLDQRVAFRNSLVRHLHAFSQVATVRERLALCVACLCVHQIGSGEWPDAMPVLCKAFSEPKTALTLLELLTYAPDEANSRRNSIPYKVVDEAQLQLRNFSPTVLSILTKFINSTGTDRGLQQRVFACFLSWVRNGVPLKDLHKHPLFALTFQALVQRELLPVTCDVIAELLAQARESLNRDDEMALVLIRQVLGMGPLWEGTTRQPDSLELCKKLALVFTELGKTNVSYVLECSPTGNSIMQLILRATVHPDKDVGTVTLHFWDLLSHRITRALWPPQRDGEPPVPPKMTAQQLALFKPYYCQLVQALIGVIKYPKEFDQWRADQRDEAKRYRYLAAETLLDATAVLAPQDTLKLVIQSLSQHYQSYAANPENWHALEACLYCVRSIARKIPPDEAVVMPQVMDLLPRLASQNPHLRYTATLIIGRYSEWLCKHPAQLPKLLQFVVGGLNNKEVIPSAALAFKHVCDGCASLLVQPPYIDNLFQVYSASHALSFQDQKEIIGGMAIVVSALPVARVKAGIELMIQPIAQTIFAVLNQPTPLPAGTPDRTSELAVSLSRLAEILKSLDPAEHETPVVAQSAVEMVKRLWPMLESVVAKFLADEHTMGELCRCWKYAIKTCKQHFVPLLTPLLDLISKVFQQTPHASFLYTMSQCVSEYASAPACLPRLGQAFKDFTDKSMAVLKDQAAFVAFPDVCDDFFDLAARFLKKQPTALFANPLLPIIFLKALQGLQVPHREACRSLMQFIGTFVTLGSNEPMLNHKRGGAPNPHHVHQVQQQLVQYGMLLSDGLIMGIAGQLPTNCLKFVILVMDALITFSKDWSSKAFQISLAKAPVTTNPTKEEFHRDLFRIPRRGRSDQCDWRNAIYKWCSAVRGHQH